jgi:predicted small secreted protein
MKRKFGLLAIVLVALFILAACGGNSLVGTWEGSGEMTGATAEFLSDGTLVFTYSRGGRGYVGEWSSEGGRLITTAGFDFTNRGPIAWAYEISGNALTMQRDGGPTQWVFHRAR